MFTIPDKGEGQNDIQSILFQEYIDVLVAGIAGSECVLSGCAATAQGSPNMTVACAKGAVLSQGVMFAVAAANFTITTADATNPRIDLCVITSAGAKAVRAGTAAAAPKPPARSAGDVVVAAVYVPANDTTISSDQIVDMRVMRTQGPIVIYKTTAAETTNTTAAAIHMLNKAGSGVTIPNGLFLSGRVLRCRIWGNFLYNNTTPTNTIAISYGGTTMFSDVSGASTNDTDRAPFDINFAIVAQANNDQALGGTLALGLIAAKTAPATGMGDAWSTASNINAVAGSAAVDSDAADRVLAVTSTLSVSNAANEVVVEGAVLELI